MNNLIDNPYDLLSKSRNELDEILLDEKYNKANLRELVRRTLKMANEMKYSIDYYKKLDEKRTQKTNEMKEYLENIKELLT